MHPVTPTGCRPRLLRAALAAADRGWPVLPLFPGSKRPAIAGWQHHATTDPATLEIWWAAAPYNIGVACGPARLLVVDLDSPDGECALVGINDGHPVPATYTVATPNGHHHYFTVDLARPGRSTVKLLGPHIDTRAAGAYAVAAGSVRTVDGRPQYYRHVIHARASASPAPAPEWLLSALTPPAPAASVKQAEIRGRTARPHAYIQAAAAGEARRVRAAAPGQRNHALFTAALRLGQLTAESPAIESDVTDLLRAASQPHVGIESFTAAEAERAIANGLGYGRRRSRAAGP